MLLPTTLHLQITAEGSTHTAILTQENGGQITAKITIPQVLHTQVDQLLESMRGTTLNKATPGLPVNIQKLEAETIALLHNHIFENAIGEAIKKQLAALEEKQELILVVSSPDAVIRNLPWEMLLGSPTMRRMAITRSLHSSLAAFKRQEIPAPTAAPLKLLFVTALPVDKDERNNLQIEHEQRKLIEAVRNLETDNRNPKIMIEFLDVASLTEIQAALMTRRHDILHVSGHGGFNEKVRQAVLHLENEDGEELVTEGKVFAEALCGITSLRLVVLNACETAVTDTQSGTVEAVAAAGIPAVVGMRFAINDSAAKVFTEHFYHHLANGSTITQALTQAHMELFKLAKEERQANPTEPKLGEWFTPVLYLNGAMGSLVDATLPYKLPADFYPRDQDGKRRIGSGFIGRKWQLIQMRKAFQGGKHICLLGLGGMGKTTLAEAFSGSYENGAYKKIFLQGKAAISQMGIMYALLSAFGELGMDELGHLRIKNFLEDGKIPMSNRLDYLLRHFPTSLKVILLLDNFEDHQILVEEGELRGIQDKELASFLAHLLKVAPKQCRVLITSRYSIEGMDALDPINLGKLSFLEQYRLMTYSEVLRQFTSEERDRIYYRLGGLPRAYEYLEVLAGQESFDFEELDAVLEDVTGQVFENLMLGKIYDLLDVNLQRVFLVASVFFTRTHVQALMAAFDGQFTEGILRDYLGRLSDWGLCFWDLETREFEIHALTREWIVNQKLLAEDERKRLALAAGLYFQTSKAVDTVELSIAYFEIAEEWETFADISFRLSKFYISINHYLGAWNLSNMVLQKVNSPKAQYAALGNIGLLLFHSAQYAPALSAMEQSLKICWEIGDKRGEATNWTNISHIHSARGEYDLALECLNRSRFALRQLGENSEESTVVNNMGQIYKLKGDYENAMQCYLTGLKYCLEGHDKYGEAISLSNIGQILEEQGQIASSFRNFSKSLRIGKEIGSLAIVGTSLNNISLIYLKREEYQIAFHCMTKSLEMRREINDLAGECSNLNNFGTLYIRLGEYEIAKEYLEQALKLARRLGNLEGQGTTLNGLCVILMMQGDLEMALEKVNEAIVINEEMVDVHGIASCFQNKGSILQGLRRYEEAVKYLVKAQEILKKLNSANQNAPNIGLESIRKEIGEPRYKNILSTLDLENL